MDTGKSLDLTDFRFISCGTEIMIELFLRIVGEGTHEIISMNVILNKSRSIQCKMS